MTFHFLERDALCAAAERAVGRDGFNERKFRDWLRRQPRAPHLVGSTVAAGLLGVQPPHLARLRDQGRLPDPVPIEGSVDAYIREEIEALAKELAEERQRRAERRKARATA